jgi:hypothetical protein
MTVCYRRITGKVKMQEKKREKFEKEILDEKSFCLLVFHPLD